MGGNRGWMVEGREGVWVPIGALPVELIGVRQIPRGHLQHFSSSHKLYRVASGIWQSSWILGTTEEGSADLCPLKSQPVSLARRTGWGLMKMEKR